MRNINKKLEADELGYIKISPVEFYGNNNTKTAEHSCADIYNSAVTALKNAMYNEATMQFGNCLAAVPNDPRSLIGLYCSKIGDNRYFDHFSGAEKQDVTAVGGKKVSDIHELEQVMLVINNAAAIQNILDYIFSCGIDEKDVDFTSITEQRLEHLLCYCVNEENQIKYLKAYLEACRAAGKTEKCGSAFDAFTKIIKYIPPEKTELITKYTDEFVDMLLSGGAFDKVQECVKLLTSFSKSYTLKARYSVLLASLECRNEDELLHCEGFNAETPAYVKLLNICKNDTYVRKHHPEALGKYEDLLSESLKVRANDKKSRDGSASEKNKGKEREPFYKKFSFIYENELAIFLIEAPVILTLLSGLLVWLLNSYDPMMKLVVFGAMVLILFAATLITDKLGGYIDICGSQATLAVILVANCILPLLFAFVNYYTGGYVWLGMIAFALALVATVVETFLIASNSLFIEDCGSYFNHVLASIAPISLGVTAFIAFVGDASLWIGVLLLSLSVAAYVLLGIFGKDRYSDFLSVFDISFFTRWFGYLTTAFFALLFAAISVFVISWNGIGILLGVLSVVASIAAAVWTVINIRSYYN